jgi:hypothetical protein
MRSLETNSLYRSDSDVWQSVAMKGRINTEWLHPVRQVKVGTRGAPSSVGRGAYLEDMAVSWVQIRSANCNELFEEILILGGFMYWPHQMTF